MNEPTSLVLSTNVIRAGDSIIFTESLPDYPASAGWSLKYRLIWPTGSAVDINTTVVGDDYEINLTSADTASWTAGKATLVSWVEKVTDRVTLEQKAVTILPDLTLAVTHDGRSANKQALDAAEAALVEYLKGGQATVAEYEVAGRRMKFRDTDQILALINRYKSLVARENAVLAMLQGGGMPGRFYYRG